jgi:tRNA1Val (adenine37-N6)-methyltransferase
LEVLRKIKLFILKREQQMEKRKKDKQFHFKQFSVRHDRSGMKVGTDGVLLGAWVDVQNIKRILDIGTGTGLIALILAQRTESNVTIDAIEIDDDAIEDASENFAASPWNDRLTLHHQCVQEFNSSEKFDLIVSNPPYFIDSFKPPNDQRIIARHAESLSFPDLLSVSEKLLSDKGRLNVVLPYTEGLQFIDMAEKNGFYCSRKWSFRTRKEKAIERFLLEFSSVKTDLAEGEIQLYSSGEIWSEGYLDLTRNFYLKV